MKNIVCLIFVALVCICCSEKEGEPLTKPSDERKADIQQMKQEFMPYLSGVWIPAKYYTELNRTKSPLKSYDKLRGIAVMIFPEEMENDSIHISSSLNNHEGYGFHLLFEKSIGIESFKTNISSSIYDVDNGFCDIHFKVSGSDTILNLQVYNKDKKLVKKIPFNKIRDKQPEVDGAWGVDYYANKLLFEGKYTLLDSTNLSREVEFMANGLLIGFDPYKNFSVCTDFGTRVENNLDNINFEKDIRNFDNYLYKFDGDTISIHRPVYTDEREILYTYGAVVYQLIKKK